MSGRRFVDALILKGGGVKGLAFAGAVQELENHFEFQTFVGTSAGAIAAALLAAGATGTNLERRLRKKSFRDFLDGRSWAAFVTIPLFGGIHPGLSISNWIRDELWEIREKRNEVYLKDLVPRRAVIYASQATRGPITFDSEYEHKDWTVYAAVRCSLSIPYFFRPQYVDQQWAYDGGLLNNFPVEIFLDQERNRTPARHPDFVALYLGTAKPPALKLGYQVPALLSLMIERNDRDVLERYRDKTIVIDTDPIGTIDFNLTDEEKNFLIVVGRAAALEFLSDRGLTDRQAALSLKLEAENLRDRIKNNRQRRRWLLVLPRLLVKSFAAIAAFFAILAFVIGSVLGPLAPPRPDDPLASLEKLTTYLRR